MHPWMHTLMQNARHLRVCDITVRKNSVLPHRRIRFYDDPRDMARKSLTIFNERRADIPPGETRTLNATLCMSSLLRMSSDQSIPWMSRFETPRDSVIRFSIICTRRIWVLSCKYNLRNYSTTLLLYKYIKIHTYILPTSTGPMSPVFLQSTHYRICWVGPASISKANANGI